MSNVGIRALLAAAASEVPGVSGFPTMPDGVTEGAAWPQWRGLSTDNEQAGLTNSWSVVFAVGSDYEAVDAWIDEHLDAVWDAIQPVMFIDSIEPTQITTGTAGLVGLTVTGHRE